MSNPLIPSGQFFEEMALAMRDAVGQLKKINRDYEQGCIDRVLALKPDKDGRVKFADIRKARRGQ
jgi:hypothetical protein